MADTFHPAPLTTRLWSEEVAQAEAAEPLPQREDGYVMSNGRKFKDGNGIYEVIEGVPQ